MGVSLSDVKEVASLASSVFKLGETWYDDTPQAVEEIRFLFTNAERSYLDWESRAQRYGLTSDGTLLLSLRNAKEQLQGEENRLTGLNTGFGRLCLCLRLWSGTKVPDRLRNSITDLNSAISSNWKCEGDAEKAARERAEYLAKAPRFEFRRDRRYVKIPNIEGKLKEFLNHEGQSYGEAQIVLLHGRAGSGKSSIARHLALDYQEATTVDTKAEAFATDGASASKKDGASTSDRKCFPSTSTEKCRKFHRVFYLDCGPGADWENKQAEFLGMLPEARTSETETERKKGDPAKVESQLRQLLKDTVSLIIFDDVWDGTFLNRMVGVCGQHMKILVTAQKQSLSKSFTGMMEPPSISMDQIMPEDSFRILMVLTGFLEESMIPEDVKKCMEELLEKVKGHPHALASFAAGIDANHEEELQQWYDVIDTHEKYLETFDDPDHLLIPHDVSYKHSVFGAIQVKDWVNTKEGFLC